MALVNNTVAIPFVPLLRDICSVLNIDAPRFEIDSLIPGSVSAFVVCPESGIEHIFHGYGQPTVEGCYEMAARQMAVFLVEKHSVMVYDVNLPRRIKNEHCAQMYGCKYDYFLCIQRGSATVPVYEITPVEGLDYAAKRVDIDFLALLDTVAKKFDFALTPIIVEHVVPDCFYAWLTIPVPGSISPTHGVMGCKATTIDVAKQSLAKEALTLLSMWYRFEVQDVNYYLLAQGCKAMEAQRGAYERLREKLFGLKACEQPVPYVIEQDCETPRGERTRIPEPEQPPPPSKRQRLAFEDAPIPSEDQARCDSPDAFSY